MQWSAGLREQAGRNVRRSLMIVVLTLASGCASDGAPDLAGLGGMLGAIAGPETKGRLVGDDVGEGVGYVIGDEADRAKAARLDAAEHYEVGRIGATRWRVLDVQPYGRLPAFEEMMVYFRPDGRVETTTKFADGRTEEADESYRVVGGTIILTRRGYLINTKYWITGQQMILDGDDFRITLLRLPS